MKTAWFKTGVKMVGLLLIVGIVFGAVTLFRLINQPAIGSINPVPPKSKPATRFKPPMTTLRGKTITFEYPNDLHQTTPDKLSVNDIEKFSFLHAQLPTWNLDIQIRKLPTGNLADDGSYNLRKQYPQQYREQKLTINALPVSIMTAQTGSFDEVAFTAQGDRVAEVALTSSQGTVGDPALHEALVNIFRNWQWR